MPTIGSLDVKLVTGGEDYTYALVIPQGTGYFLDTANYGNYPWELVFTNYGGTNVKVRIEDGKQNPERIISPMEEWGYKLETDVEVFYISWGEHVVKFEQGSLAARHTRHGHGRI